MRRSLVLGVLASLALIDGSSAPALARMIEPAPAREPPVALTASDGAGLRITSFQARAAIEDPLAFTELHLTFHNPEPRQIEGTFQITLPPGATISRFAMRQASGWQEGEVVELQAARQAYEDFLHRRQDPALLEKQAGNQFHARVFPIPPSGDKEIIISYSQELPNVEDPYKIFLHGLPKLDLLDIKLFLGKRQTGQAASTLGGVTLSNEVIEVKKREFTPEVDFAVPLPRSDNGLRLGLRHDNLTVARITPVTDAQPDKVENLLVLVDSSASRALGFKAELDRLVAILHELQQTSGAQTPIKVACFDQEVVEMYAGPIGGFGANQLGAILERRALGASDLSKALRWVAAGKERRFARVLMLTDGIATAGATEGQDLRQAVSTLGNSGVKRLDVVVTGGIRDEAMLKRLVTGGLSRDGVVLDDAMPPSLVAHRLSSATYSGIKVTAPGSAWVWPTELNGIQPGDQILVYADLPAARPLEIVLEGARAGRHPVRLAQVDRPLLERSWVNARIQRLQHQRETLAGSDADLRDALKKQIIELSTKFRVLCDFTALLVLESEQDYARFNIDRRALSDLLVVGPDGIELENRRANAVVLLPAPDRIAEKPPLPENKESGADRAKRGNGDPLDDSLQGHAETEATNPVPATTSPVMKAPSRSIGGASDDERSRSAEQRPRPSPQSNAQPRHQPPPPPPDAPASGHGSASRHVSAPDEAPMDSDHDGIPDAVDRCPNEPETFNGYEDEDGCPDRGRVIVESGRLEVLDRIYFETGNALIKPISFPILDAMAATLRANPRIAVVEIQGHSDARGDAAFNLRLTSQRAASVRAYLIDKGIDSRRLVSRGYGETRPLCAEHNETCWTKNRRVEFVILRTNDGTVSEGARQSPPQEKPAEPSPYEGRLREVMRLVEAHRPEPALTAALAWRDQEPGDVLALIAVGEASEALGKKRLAARAYGSIIDLFPARADLRRFAGERLERLGQDGQELAIDTYKQARASRPDHPASHRLLAYALLRAGQPAQAFDVIVEGARTPYPSGRFAGVARILGEDVGLIAAAWIHREPNRRKQILERLAGLGVPLPESRSLRFVLNWETDANDVDFHIFDAQGGHAYYSQRALASGGELYADVTTGYGPECFTIPGAPRAYPYRLQAHYYSRGPMGYGMGKLEIIEHDGHGNLAFEERPFVIMVDRAFVNLGEIAKPLLK